MAITDLRTPGVFIQENDRSYIPIGPNEANAAFVGPTLYGPAFEPIIVTSYNDYLSKFGSSDGKSYMPYAIQSYLENSNSATIIRILGTTGYTHTGVPHVIMSGSYGKKAIATLHRSVTATKLESEESLASSSVTFTSPTNFILKISGSYTNLQNNYSCSVNTTDSTFIGKQLSTNPQTSDVAYASSLFSKSMNSLYLQDSGSVVSLEFTDANFDNVEFSAASTPWITSQKIGSVSTNLFKCYTISDGVNTNKLVKVAISDVKFADEVPNSDYGTFTLTVRQWNDTDKTPVIYETYVNLTLDPDSPNYIARVIGDMYPTYVDGDIQYAGNYSNKSKYIFVEVNDDIENKALSPVLVPFGFRAVQQPLVLPTNTTYPTASFITDQVSNSEYNTKIHYGFDFNFNTNDNEQYLNSLENESGVGLNVDFNLGNYLVNSGSTVDPGVNIETANNINARKFILPFQGGFDGQDPATYKAMGSNITSSNTMGFNVGTADTDDFISYTRAINILANKEYYNINLLSTPGLIYKYHPALIQKFIDLCEDRGDVFYPIDGSPLGESEAGAISNVESLDSSYASDSYPWVEILDQTLNKNVWVPLSTQVMGAIAFSDRNSYEWSAPAGLNRGGLTKVLRAYKRLNTTSIGNLYANRINPAATFPQEGVTMWGQKTLQVRSSALDRINVRRLLINLKKFIQETGRTIIFEPNDRKTQQNYLNRINPYMESIKQRSGLYQYLAVMDDTNNTSDVIDRNILVLDVYIKPTKTAEFLQVNLNILPSGQVIEI